MRFPRPSAELWHRAKPTLALSGVDLVISECVRGLCTGLLELPSWGGKCEAVLCSWLVSYVLGEFGVCVCACGFC